MLVSLDFCICDFNNKNVPLRWSLKSSDGSLSAPNKLFAFVARKAASRACNQVDMNDHDDDNDDDDDGEYDDDDGDDEDDDEGIYICGAP